jgi:hypothetical protein
MNLRRLFSILSLALMVGCATTAGYEKVLNSWMGQDISNLIEKWGPPSNVFTMPDGRILYSWVFDGGAVAVPIGNMAYAVPRGCKTTFTTSSAGVVQNWRWEGNACER